ncbi:MAG TPA: protein phosphatase 2C domain-containing protein [Gemmataceae bacterium]|nr:protein phosphatase 2C domain-containing protein [Gemmataceae bacterium]
MIRLLTFSEAGGHPENEDAFLANQLPGEPEGALVCVADGQGGRAGGRKAARLACEVAAATACSRTSEELADSGAWQTILSDADAAVAADAEAGFTTLIGFAVRNEFLVGASCGDSAVFVVSGTELLEPTKRQFKNPPVGSGEADFIPFEVRLARPWRVLAMSDGVWKYAGWQRVRELAARLGGEELIAALQAAARLRLSGEFPDDFTVVLVEAD